MSPIKVFVIYTFAMLTVCCAKPSHPYGVLHHSAQPDHFDFTPPVLPPAEFHTNTHTHLLPAAPETLWSASAPAPLWPAPAPLWRTEAPLWPSPAVLPAPEPLWPAPEAPTFNHFIPAPAPLIPAPLPAPCPLPITRDLPPLYEATAFAAPPTYRATFGPKTTTHHVSVGYAFPQRAYAKVLAPLPHAHLHAAPLALSHQHHHLKSLW